MNPETEQREEKQEKEEWIDTMTAAKRFNVSTTLLYRLAYANPSPVETETIPMGKGKLRQQLLFKVSSLEAWDANRNSHFKRRSQKSETQGRTGSFHARMTANQLA